MKRQQLKSALGDEHFDKDFCLGYSYYTCHGVQPGLGFLGADADMLTNNPSASLSKYDLSLPLSDHPEKKNPAVQTQYSSSPG